MRPYQPRRRRALALPLVFVVIVIISIGAAAVNFLLQANLRRTRTIRRDTEHLYLGEAVLANIVNRLKKAPWEDRYYASGPAPCSEMFTGSYRGADYVAIVEDVVDPDTSAVIPDLTDVLLRITYQNVTRNFFARVTVTMPTVLRPTNVNVDRIFPVDADVTDATLRGQTAADATADHRARLDAEAEANVIAREVAALAADGVPADQIESRLAELALDGIIATERDILDAWHQFFVLARSSSATKYLDAAIVLADALALAEGLPTIHRAVNVPRTLYHLARAAVGEYEVGITTLIDPTINPSSDPALRDILLRALGYLDTVVDDHPTSRDRPYAMLAQAAILRRLGDLSAAGNKLDDLANDYGDLHLWGEDQTVAGRCPDDGVVTFHRVLLDPDGEYFLSAEHRPDGVPQVYFITESGRRIRITNDPRMKDLLTVTNDGGRIAYRALQSDGSFRCIAVDADGNTLVDLTPIEEGDWRPSWAETMDEIPFNPVLYESLPETIETTHPADVSNLPALTGIGPSPTMDELLSYGYDLHNELLNPPYDVFPPRLLSQYLALKHAEIKMDIGKAVPGHGKKKHKNDKAMDRIFNAVTFLEAVKDSYPAGADKWQF